MRSLLHTKATLSANVVDEVCDALHIPVSAFPMDFAGPPLKLLPGAKRAIRAMSDHATVVTLSNVTCLETNANHLERLNPWISGHFPSCHIGFAKPDPSAFRLVAQENGKTTRELIHIGDDWECDVIGAIEAGARAIWISGDREKRPGKSWSSQVFIAGDIVAASQLVAEFATRELEV